MSETPRPRHSRRRRPWIAAGLTLVVVAACGSPQPSPSPVAVVPVAVPSVSPSIAPSPTPLPSATPHPDADARPARRDLRPDRPAGRSGDRPPAAPGGLHRRLAPGATTVGLQRCVDRLPVARGRVRIALPDDLQRRRFDVRRAGAQRPVLPHPVGLRGRRRARPLRRGPAQPELHRRPSGAVHERRRPVVARPPGIPPDQVAQGAAQRVHEHQEAARGRAPLRSAPAARRLLPSATVHGCLAASMPEGRPSRSGSRTTPA